MELRHLRYFVVVAEELHFGRAAARLNMSQPPLSRQIQELEEELGVLLFVREYHKVALTEAGKAYLKHASQILEQVTRAGQEVAGIALGRTGVLRVGHGTLLPDGFATQLLSAFQQAARGVAIELLEAPTPRVLHALREKSIDVGLVLAPANDAGLVVKPLWSEPLVIALPANHAYATAPLEHLSQLANENFITCRRYEDPGYREIVEAICRRAGFAPRVQQAVEHGKTILDLVAAGLGIAFVQYSVTAAPATAIRYVQFPGSIPFIDTVVTWRDDTRHESLELFVATVQKLGVRHGRTSRSERDRIAPASIRVGAERGDDEETAE